MCECVRREGRAPFHTRYADSVAAPNGQRTDDERRAGRGGGGTGWTQAARARERQVSRGLAFNATSSEAPSAVRRSLPSCI